MVHLTAGNYSIYKKIPREMNNIYSNSSSKGMVAELKKELLHLAKQYKDTSAVNLMNRQ